MLFCLYVHKVVAWPGTEWHRAKALMSAGRSTEHDHEKQKHEENCKRLSHGNVLSPARQLISFFFSPFGSTSLFYYILNTGKT